MSRPAHTSLLGREPREEKSDEPKRERQMAKRKRRDRALAGAALMPVLAHSTGDGPFDIMGSDAAAWLCSLPEVRQYVFDAAKECGYIVYDRESGKWAGVER